MDKERLEINKSSCGKNEENASRLVYFVLVRTTFPGTDARPAEVLRRILML